MKLFVALIKRFDDDDCMEVFVAPTLKGVEADLVKWIRKNDDETIEKISSSRFRDDYDDVKDIPTELLETPVSDADLIKQYENHESGWRLFYFETTMPDEPPTTDGAVRGGSM